MGSKNGSHEPRVVLRNFYMQILLTNIISSLIEKFNLKSNF